MNPNSSLGFVMHTVSGVDITQVYIIVKVRGLYFMSDMQ